MNHDQCGIGKLLFAIAQLYLPFADAVDRWIGISQFTKRRVEMQTNRDLGLINKPI
ncbi:hypothetical protein NIES4103_55240 [Nostoc sp. NIES-4103]|nr:hypothetical protein NIES4103_55240 [Nostoc sp. NIES-4103]